MAHMSKAAVIGGSLTGLAVGILLRRLGWEVDIYERNPNRLSDRGAGIVMQSATREMLRLLGGKHDAQVAVPMTYRRYLNPDGSLLSSQVTPSVDDVVGTPLRMAEARISGEAVSHRRGVCRLYASKTLFKSRA